ncbi:MAG TPA: hypothetical protein VKD72_20900 [Gemmataceae bacterium]|nr:hypothetical protein [Gemmataceae bacterium]
MADAGVDYAQIAVNIRTEVLNETKRRADLTAQGKPPPISYSIDGRSVSYTEWVKSMLDAARTAEEMVAALNPYEIHEHGG